MDILEQKTDQELLQSLIAETAKSQNELKCAQRDLEKAQSRLSFCLVLLNNLINRTGD
jgi:hypothetical protein